MKTQITFKDFVLFIEAWLFIAIARLLLSFLPFKKIVPLLGKVNKNKYDAMRSADNTVILKKIGTAILRGSRYSPWRAKCFEQALAAKMMLKKRGTVSAIYFGVYRSMDCDKLLAHAWLTSGDEMVTGGKNIDQYTVVGSFIN